MRFSRQWACLLLAAVLFAAAGCRRQSADLVQGYIEGEFVYVASPFGGRLENLAVARGGQVEPGQLLFGLDDSSERAEAEEATHRVAEAEARLNDAKQGMRPSEIRAIAAQLEEAKAALVLAELELERQTKLLASRVASKRDVDLAQATRDEERQRVTQLDSTLETSRLGAREDIVHAAGQNVLAEKAALEAAQWNLSQKRQSATQAAMVTDTLYRRGDWVAAGNPVVVLLPPANVKVRTYVPQEKIGSMQVGQDAEVLVDGVPGPVAAKVSFISPRAEYTPPVIYSRQMREKLVFLVELSVGETVAATLHPGQPVDVRFRF